ARWPIKRIPRFIPLGPLQQYAAAPLHLRKPVQERQDLLGLCVLIDERPGNLDGVGLRDRIPRRSHSHSPQDSSHHAHASFPMRNVNLEIRKALKERLAELRLASLPSPHWYQHLISRRDD